MCIRDSLTMASAADKHEKPISILQDNELLELMDKVVQDRLPRALKKGYNLSAEIISYMTGVNEAIKEQGWKLKGYEKLNSVATIKGFINHATKGIPFTEKNNFYFVVQVNRNGGTYFVEPTLSKLGKLVCIKNSKRVKRVGAPVLIFPQDKYSIDQANGEFKLKITNLEDRGGIPLALVNQVFHKDGTKAIFFSDKAKIKTWMVDAIMSVRKKGLDRLTKEEAKIELAKLDQEFKDIEERLKDRHLDPNGRIAYYYSFLRKINVDDMYRIYCENDPESFTNKPLIGQEADIEDVQATEIERNIHTMQIETGFKRPIAHEASRPKTPRVGLPPEVKEEIEAPPTQEKEEETEVVALELKPPSEEEEEDRRAEELLRKEQEDEKKAKKGDTDNKR